MDLSQININFWILQSIAMALTALALPRLRITSFFGATVMVVALALVNAHIWDAALFLSIPNSLSVHALVLFLANAAIFWTLVKVLPGIEISGVLTALAAPTLFSLISIVLSSFGSQIDFLDIGKQGLTKIEEAREHLKQEKEKEDATKETDAE